MGQEFKLITLNLEKLKMPVARLKCKCGCGRFQLRAKVVKKPFGNFFNETHAGNYAVAKFKRDKAKKLAKAKQVRASVIKVNRKAVTELNRKTLSWQHKQTQPVFNKLRRLQEFKWFSDRGIDPLCISCQKPLGNDQWCNGHFKSVGANGRLRYDFKNSYLQHNHNCNKHKSGDASEYEKGLIARFGKEEGESIIGYCEVNNAPMKRTWQDLEELRKEFNKQIKLLINVN